MGIPSGKSPKFDIADLDMIFTLPIPYTDTELEEYILMLFDKCFSEQCKDEHITSIEKFYKVKGYAKATKNLRLVSLHWLKNAGYFVVPTKNTNKMGFQHIENNKILLPTDYLKGTLAKAFKQAMAVAQ